MEDHLRNRDRLAKEWQALCAYQAEPNTCATAQGEGNIKKNRHPDFLPCESCWPAWPSPLSAGNSGGLGGGAGRLAQVKWQRDRHPNDRGAPEVRRGVCADDHARIKLKVESSPSRSDYINASPIVSGPSSSPLLCPVFILPA